MNGQGVSVRSSPRPVPTSQGPLAPGCAWLRRLCSQKGPGTSLPSHELLKHSRGVMERSQVTFMHRDSVQAPLWRVTLLWLVKGLGLGNPRRFSHWGCCVFLTVVRDLLEIVLCSEKTCSKAGGRGGRAWAALPETQTMPQACCRATALSAWPMLSHVKHAKRVSPP